MSDPSASPDRAADALAGLVAASRPLADRFADAGYRVYLVGGVVRDLLLGRPVGGDIDLTTDATPDRTIALLEGWAEVVWTQGARFGTIGCRLNGRIYEITTHRAEVYVPDSRKPTVAFSSDVTEDLARRDFTVNAMARAVPEGLLVDPHGGQADLAAGRLRTPLDPHVTLSEDPLRMVRAARFAASHDLEPDPLLVKAMTDMAGRLAIVATERIRAEIDRLLVTPAPSRGLALLGRTGVLAEILPEHALLPAPEWTELLDRVDRTPPDLVARLVVLHDGVIDVDAAMRRMRSANEQTAAARSVRRAVDLLAAVLGPAAGLVAHAAGGDDARDAMGGDTDGGDAGAVSPVVIEDATVRRFAAMAGLRLDAARAAVAGELGPTLATALATALERLAAAGELEDLGPQLDGTAVMALLGMEPGPQVGEALAFLGELRLIEGRLGRADLEDRLRTWWATARGATGGGGAADRQAPNSW